ncbi:hypothetical protein [Hydrogenophaga sp. T2]|uniref:hypothetical protein n=1 Tax=Hydrogenophaga sp. T2 TaxID=3132823 RepID=UPI003CF26FB0
MSKHTPGRLKAFNLYATPEIRDQGGNFIACGKDGSARAVADTRRLAACWNACDGISTEHLEQHGLPNFAQTISDMRAQRDELLFALREAQRLLLADAPGVALQVVEDAIAKATGEQP